MDAYYRNYNLSDGVDQSLIVNEQLVSERWQHVLQYKWKFLSSNKEDPRRFPYINKAVADSWVRARNMGIDPYQVVKEPQISDQELEEIRHKNELLINTAQNIIDKLEQMFCDWGPIVYLIDPGGVILLHEGNWTGNRPFPEYSSRVGIVANEETIGTNAHELSIRLQKPIQLLGPEHYSLAFQNNLASAAPILDQDQKTVAALLLLSKPLRMQNDRYLAWQSKSELALVSSMALAIEARLKLSGAEKPINRTIFIDTKNPAVDEEKQVKGRAFSKIIGKSPAITKAVRLAKRLSSSPENILLTGESGTGKEIFAEAIHQCYCPEGPFIAVNCAAMPRELITSELFGYEGGSFTGAERKGKPGKIELADGGIFFLDEIGDMPLELQPVLLRVLEDKKVNRIGGSNYKEVNFRLIAATNKNLYQMVQENKFREDLYFRLSVLTVHIPPLRQREEDVLLLSNYFIEQYCIQINRPKPRLSTETVKKLMEYDWPGNVRQLKNAMIYAVNICEGNIIEPEDLPGQILMDQVNRRLYPNHMAGDNLKEMLCITKLEKSAIETALMHTNNSVAEAAQLLGLSRSTLYRKIKEYGIEL